MFCPACGNENRDSDFCRTCQTNLAIISRFLAREDANARRSRILSRTGLVSIFISEGFAWTLAALALFVLIIFLATIFLPRPLSSNGDFIASGILLTLMAICGVPLLLGLVLLLKDFTYVRPKRTSTQDLEKK